jgi:hypothetical protein
MTNRLVQPHIAKSSVRKRIFREPGLCVARRGLPPSADDAVDGGSAQIGVIHHRLCGRIITDRLLPFAVGPGTGKADIPAAWQTEPPRPSSGDDLGRLCAQRL